MNAFLGRGSKGGMPLVWIWGVLLVLMICVLFTGKYSARTLAILFMLCFLLETALHLFYGRVSEFFLYTPHWTFMLPVLMGLFLTVIRKESAVLFRLVTACLWVFLTFMAANNAVALTAMYRLLTQ
jgi:hypothetical protein